MTHSEAPVVRTNLRQAELHVAELSMLDSLPERSCIWLPQKAIFQRHFAMARLRTGVSTVKLPIGNDHEQCLALRIWSGTTTTPETDCQREESLI